MSSNLLIYGVTGYTGALIARLAHQSGLPLLVAGRNPAAVAAQSAQLGVAGRAFALDDPVALAAALADVAVLLNCAGPFSATARPLATACIQAGVHYLDLAGEVPEFEALLPLDAAAVAAGVMLMPGVGFGVVPTDCLALHLKQRLPSATRLTLAFETVGGVSQGTLNTLLADVPHLGVVRQGGILAPARVATRQLRIDLGGGIRTALLNPWRADLSTAYHSTGIPNIETYTVFPGPIRWLLQPGGSGMRLLTSQRGQHLVQRLIQRLPPGPSDKALARGLTRVWGEVSNENGQRIAARLRGPEAYLFTARSALAIAQRVLQAKTQPGYQTPARVYGVDLLRSIAGVVVADAT